MSNRDNALAYAKSGFKVFPCSHYRKKPKILGGFNNASNSVEQIEKWDSLWADGLIGIACSLNNIVVIDFDFHKEASKDCLEQFEKKFNHSLAAHPYRVKTKRGGLHVYYKVSAGADLRGRNDAFGIKGIDVKFNGYAIAADGINYKLDGSNAGFDPGRLASIPELPECLFSQLVVSGSPVEDDYATIGSVGKCDDEGENCEFDAELFRDALTYISAEPRDDWLRYGGALWIESGWSELGFDVWTEWSKTCPHKFDAEEQFRYWHKEFPKPKRKRAKGASILHRAMKNGWKRKEKAEPERALPELPELPSEVMQDGGELTEKTLVDVRNLFSSWGHNPSEQHMFGIGEVARAVEHMANGILAPNFYVSSLAPGAGKTTAICVALRHLIRLEEYEEVGAIVFLSRLEEIKKLVEQIGLAETEFAVLTSDPALNRLGLPGDKTKARVIFSTQQRLEHFGSQKFSDLKEFFFEGKPRHVRIWDEAILPTEAVTLSANNILRSIADLRESNFGVIGDLLHDFESTVLKEAKDKDVIQFPDLLKVCATYEDVRAKARTDAAKLRIKDLFFLSGKEVKVRIDEGYNTVLDYVEILPSDIAPMLILDASGMQRKTYELWSAEKKNLRLLTSPAKSYEGLTTHHLNMAAGAKAHVNNSDGIAQDVADLINDKIPQGEKVLIITRKENKEKSIPDMRRCLEAKINRSDLTIGYLTWGRETATNEFHEMKHVILVSVPQYQTSSYEAIARGAKGIKAHDELSEDEFIATALGEFCHRVFQAANRGFVRKMKGDQCPNGCHLYAIFSTKGRHGIPSNIFDRIFPGHRKEDWLKPPKLKGQKKAALDYVFERFRQGDGQLSKKELRKAVGVEDASNFNRTVLQNRDFIRSLQQQDLVMIDEGGVVKFEKRPTSCTN